MAQPKALASAQAELLAQYGYDKIAMTLGPLQRLGLLKRNDGRSTWPTLKKALRLVVDDLPEYEVGAEPADMAYVYAGYAPLSVRIVAASARASGASPQHSQPARRRMARWAENKGHILPKPKSISTISHN